MQKKSFIQSSLDDQNETSKINSSTFRRVTESPGPPALPDTFFFSKSLMKFIFVKVGFQSVENDDVAAQLHLLHSSLSSGF